MIKLKPTYIAALLAVSSSALNAAELSLEIQNLTHGLYFTPILAVAHTPETSIFEVGETASTELQMMAEGGSLDGLSTIVTSINADVLANPAGGLWAPSAKAAGTLSTAAGNTILSVVAMMLPTNDGFIGLDNWTIPTETGTYTIYFNAYDAGTEANDEIRGSGAPGAPGMPVPPPLEALVGNGGSGVAGADNNATVQIHRGSIDDNSMTDGTSDVTNTVQRWLNPVAKVTISVN
jgi:hypothetical protein